MNIPLTVERALGLAGLKPDSDIVRSITDTVRRALAGKEPEVRPQPATSGEPARKAAAVVDVDAHWLDTPDASPSETVGGDVTHDAPHEAPHETSRDAPSARGKRSGEFLGFTFTSSVGSRAYKLYVPASYTGQPAPLVVMLHGCKQDPDDFATGTRMNLLAERDGFLVAYPAQARNANGSNCWNWFRAEDQERARGEPAIIAGITREIANAYAVDKQRVFVAGLSAGAAMAVILGETFPELYSGVGAHSGLPYRAAHDVVSAFSAMGKGAQQTASPKAKPVRTIVFHGDRDTTVNPGNGDAIVHRAAAAFKGAEPLRAQTQAGDANGGGYTRTIYRGPDGSVEVEHWVVHGAAHAWSGGDAQGSYAVARGPDASEEMLRFFMARGG